MYTVLLLCALAAFAQAGQNCCSMEDRRAVQEMWNSVWSAQFTGRRTAIAQEVFSRLFEKDAGTKALFANVGVDNLDSAEFRSHCIRVANGFDTLINLAFDSDALEEQLIYMGNKHAHFDGVKADHFRLMRESFAEVLPEAIPCFNRGAWNRCMKFMQDKIASSLPN
eukprot:TRINITY_DN10144_c0_g1_i1.p1 TRINITY_DN10144_c0_g1~~TRINITY_DN10144_c0_g1_i1.p1  ORF type:complete len:167 (+),score=23.92 TRINITY_DN10144_c0_g1_i1:50-550(+)